ncbi:hypothetical protein SAMD00019534_121510, partial [Acytostelium subglobosum LB1]|uniref:hypothetical protein n=1 Tax=Acytostelium subglobosum LB1 TaxID=1410327 RepID=UPI000644C7D4
MTMTMMVIKVEKHSKVGELSPSSRRLKDKSKDSDKYLDEILSPSSPIGQFKKSIDDRRHRFVDQKMLAKLKVLEFVNSRREEFEQLLLKKGASDLLRTGDKLAFVMGVLNLCIISFVYGRAPKYIPDVFAVEFCLGFILRLYSYRKKKQHYFLFDYCYYANFMLLWYTHGPEYVRSSTVLFKICFSFCNGPLMWAIVAWRNSLVFHSLDKATSVLIHILPAIVTASVRWHILPATHPIDKESLTATWTETFWIPMFFYLLWQTIYVYVMLLRQNTIRERNYITTLNFLTNHQSNSIVSRILNILPTKKVYIFMLSQLLYTILTMLPCKILYNNMNLHLGYIVCMLLVCIWNGANYYIEFFSTHYVKQLKEKEQRWKKTIVSSFGAGDMSPMMQSSTNQSTTSDNAIGEVGSSPQLLSV